MEEHKIFVSRSFDKRDAAVTEAVMNSCRAAGFIPVRTERASQSLPRDKIRDAIAESRVFLGVFTHDPERDASTKPWLITELGMAEFARLPILLFIEEGVKYEPADHIASWAVFDRDDIQTLSLDVVRALVELREDALLLQGGTDGVDAHPYRFTVDDLQMEITDDGSLVQERHIEVESLNTALRALRPTGKIITSSRLLGYHQSELEFRAGTSPVEMVFDIKRNDPSEVSYQVSFEPALERGETAAFTVTHRSRGSLPLCQEHLDQVRAGTYGTKDASRQGHAVKVPTNRLTMELRFPDGYPITECQPQLAVTLRNRVGDSALTEAEFDRIKHQFRIRHNRLELEVEFPKLDYAYYFTWHPPGAESLPSAIGHPLRGEND